MNSDDYVIRRHLRVADFPNMSALKDEVIKTACVRCEVAQGRVAKSAYRAGPNFEHHFSLVEAHDPGAMALT